MGHLLLLSSKEKKHFVSFHVSVVLFVTIHGLFSCFKEMLFFSLCVSLRVLCSLGACHQKLHKSAKHRSVEPSKRAQQIPVNLPTPLHCVRNILCLHAPPALKKVRSLTAPWLFFTASSAVYCATFLHDCVLLETVIQPSCKFPPPSFYLTWFSALSALYLRDDYVACKILY